MDDTSLQRAFRPPPSPVAPPIVFWAALCAVAGILAADGWAASPVEGVLLLFTSLLLLWLAQRWQSPLKPLFVCLALFAGAFLLHAHRLHAGPILPPSLFGTFEGVAREPGQQGPASVRFRFRLTKQFQSIPAGTELLALAKGGEVHYGERWRLSGRLAEPTSYENPGSFSYRRYLERKGITRLLFAEAMERVAPAPWSLVGLGHRLRERALKRLESSIPSPYDQVVASVIFGHRVTSLDNATKETFARAGVMHVVAASGLHLGMLLGALLLLQLLLPPRLEPFGYAATALLLFLYAVMAGLSPSVLRALIMALLFVASFSLRERYDALSALGLACLALLSLDTGRLFDVGFQLSFVAAAGILLTLPWVSYFAPSREGPLGNVLYALYTVFALSVVAALFTLPLVAYHFYRLPLLSALASLYAVPLAALTVPLGLLHGLVLPDFSYPLTAAGLLLTRCSQAVALLPLSNVQSAPPHPAYLLAFYGLLVAVTVAPQGMRRRLGVMLGALILLPALFALWPKPALFVMLDVGQGDALFFRSSSGRVLLVDGGGPIGEGESGDFLGNLVLRPFLAAAGVKRIDAMLVTHPDQDHYLGFEPLLDFFPVGQLLIPDMQILPPRFEAFLSVAQREGIPVTRLHAEMRLTLDESLRGVVLHPPRGGGGYEKPNNQSVVLHLVTSAATLVLAGDVEQEAEEYLLRRGAVPDADVLKVAHHGSRTSSTPAFLRWVSPDVALISAGRGNPYGHPHPDVVARLRAEGAQVLTTQEHGAIIVRLKKPLTVEGWATKQRFIFP